MLMTHNLVYHDSNAVHFVLRSKSEGMFVHTAALPGASRPDQWVCKPATTPSHPGIWNALLSKKSASQAAR